MQVWLVFKMSAFESITAWVETDVDIDCDQTVEQNFSDINKMFTDENRIPLERILKNDLPDFMIWLADFQQLECDEDIDDLDELVDRLIDQADALIEATKWAA